LQEPGRLLSVGLLQGLKQAPLQRREQVLLRVLAQDLERWLLRGEGRVRLRVQEQHREQAVLRCH